MEGPCLVIIKVGIPCRVVVTGEKRMGHCAPGAIKGVAIIVVSLGEVNLDVSRVARYLVEV